MDSIRFDDLLLIRKGGANLTLGAESSRLERISTPQEWQLKGDALKQLMRQTLGETPDIDCPLAPRIMEEVDCKDYVQRKVSYALEPDERTSAYVLIPKTLKEKAPAVLCIHPTTPLGKEQTIGHDPTEKGQDRAYALHLVRRGYITLAYDLLSAGERIYPGLKAFETAPFYVKYPKWSMVGKDLWDVGRAIDVLLTMPEVDTARIGSLGHSQGGGITIHAMSLDERIKAGVSSCGMLPDRLSKNPFNSARTGWWVGRPLLRPYCWTGKPFPIEVHEQLAVIAPRAIMISNAVNDSQYTLEEEGVVRPAFENMAENVREIFSLLGVASNFQMCLHDHGHSFVGEQREKAYTFLDRHLGVCRA